MAIFIGALALLGSGIDVGPSMLENNLDFTYSIVWLLALANVIATALCILLSTPISRLTNIRFVLLAPFIFMIIAFAAFQSGQDIMDLAALFAIGFLGIFLRRFDWSRPAFLIGFVLSSPVENYSNNATQIAGVKFRQGMEAGLSYVMSPIVIILIFITVISIVFGLRQAKNIMAEGEVPSGGKRAPLIFLLAVIAFICFALYNTASIPDYAAVDRVFPVFVASVSLVCGLILLVQMMLSPETHTIFADRETAEEAKDNVYGLWSTLAWFAFLLVVTGLVGFIIALTIFLWSFLRVRARLTLGGATMYTAIGVAFMCLMAWSLKRDFPGGLLQNAIELPWPLG
jgi:hypothetical protein